MSNEQSLFPPPHKTEKIFRQYEKYLHEMVAAWPTPVTFTVVGRSPRTFASRFKDCLVSLCDYHWSTEIPQAWLHENSSKIGVRINPDGTVSAGLYSTVHARPESVQGFPVTTKSGSTTALREPGPSVIAAIIVLLKAQVINPVEIYTTEDLSWVEQQESVGVVKKGENLYILC